MERQERVLVSWYTKPSYIPPFRLSERQTVVGPQLKPSDDVTGFSAITPRGAYDLKATLDAKGLRIEPELLVVWADSTLTNVPLNVKAFGCPTVLCVGDTQHMEKPLQKMVQYATHAGYDFVVSSHNRHHLHWFMEAGVRNVAWIPGIKVRHIPHPLDGPRQPRVAFVGQSGRFHPRRQRLLHALQGAGIPLLAKPGSREFAASVFADSVLSFNASLNGDVNLRVFEVLSAGGCLLTDRLATESGLAAILEDGRHMLCYGSAEEMLDKARFHLANPDAALALARAGHQHYLATLTPERQRDVLFDWVFKGQLDSLYRPDWDPRPTLGVRNRVPLGIRLRLYERVQDRHKEQERVSVVFGPGVPLCHIMDVADLPRLDAVVVEPDQMVRRALKHPLYRTRIRVVGWEEAGAAQTWDYAFLPQADEANRARIRYRTLVAC